LFSGDEAPNPRHWRIGTPLGWASPGMTESAAGAAAKVVAEEAGRAAAKGLVGYGLDVIRWLRNGPTAGTGKPTAALAHKTSEATRLAMAQVMLSDLQDESSRHLLVRDLRESLQPLLVSLAHHFQTHFTAQATSACIKLLVRPEELNSLTQEDVRRRKLGDRFARSSGLRSDEPLVFTLIRDPESERRTPSPIHPVSDCSAFEELARENAFIFCPQEDLQKLHERKLYRNPRPEFWRLYRSTLVLPIRARRHPAVNPAQLLVGFLCLDCPEPGAFDADENVRRAERDMSEQFNVAASVADALFWPLLIFSWRSHNPGPPPMPAEEARLLEHEITGVPGDDDA
jgi:hypothetical protein